MKRLLIFLLFLVGVHSIAITPISLQEYRDRPITVTIDGEVEHPGTYSLERYSTVQDLLEDAGLTEQADTSVLNEMITLRDHDTLTVPGKTEEKKISINTATAQELCTLPGIGAATAERIVKFREENGLFAQLTDLMLVSGIGEKKYEQLKDWICL